MPVIGLLPWMIPLLLVRPPSEVTGGPVLLELFTSEGCSSCPPADALLAELAAEPGPSGAERIPLSFHVDYWDGQGWKDPFSSGAFTRRQRHYTECLGERSIYTPQLIVDGAVGLVGSDRVGARAALSSAAKNEKTAIVLSAEAASGDSPDSLPLRVRVESTERAKQKSVEIFVALTEDGLVSEVTRGENKGRRLSHVGVVRFLTSVRGLDKTVRVPLGKGWDHRALSVVAWVQESPCGPALGVARMRATPPRESIP